MISENELREALEDTYGSGHLTLAAHTLRDFIAEVSKGDCITLDEDQHIATIECGDKSACIVCISRALTTSVKSTGK